MLPPSDLPLGRGTRPGRLLVRLAVLVAVAGVALTSGCSADQPTDAAGRFATATAGPSPVAKVHAPAPPGTGGSTAPTGAADGGGATPGVGSSAHGGATGADSTSGTPGSGSEVLPPTAPTPAPLVAAAPAGPRLTAPLPATASARGSIVPGFPVSIVTVPAGAKVVSSSVSSDGSRLQVGLEASTATSPAGVLAQYVQAFTAVGFTVASSPAAPGATATAFIRGSDGVVLTLRGRLGGGTELSVAGTLVAQG